MKWWRNKYMKNKNKANKSSLAVVKVLKKYLK